MKIYEIESTKIHALGADDLDTSKPCFLYTSEHGVFFVGNCEGDAKVTAKPSCLVWPENAVVADTKTYHPENRNTWTQHSCIARIMGSAHVCEVFRPSLLSKRVLRGWVCQNTFIFSLLPNGGEKATVLIPGKVRTLKPKNLSLLKAWRNGCPVERKYQSLNNMSNYLVKFMMFS